MTGKKILLGFVCTFCIGTALFAILKNENNNFINETIECIPSNLQVGDKVLSMPKDIQGIHLDGQVFLKNKQGKICDYKSNLPAKIAGFSIETPKATQRINDTPPPATLIIIRAKPEGAEDFFILDHQNQNTGPISGFRSGEIKYAGTGVMANASYFISEKEKFHTPKGNPVTFLCHQNKNQKECYTWFAWTDKVQVEYQFFDSDYPSTQWEVLHQNIWDFLKKIEDPNQ